MPREQRAKNGSHLFLADAGVRWAGGGLQTRDTTLALRMMTA